jgi:hypothetical protein
MRKPEGKDPLLGREYYIGFEIYRRAGQEMHFIWFGMNKSSGFYADGVEQKGSTK